MSWAVKADPTPVTMIQPDGTTITVIGHGDEDCHWYTTTDGILLSRNGNGFYVADISAEGIMTASAQLAHDSAMRSETEIAMTRIQDRQAFFNALDARKQNARARRIGIGETTPAYFPHEGSPKAMVILVEFADTPFSVETPSIVFDEYLNTEGEMPNHQNNEKRNYGSVKKYFTDMSDGLFTPQFDVYGPVKLAKNSAYYGENDKTTGSDINSRISEMIEDACDSISKKVDFAEYDQDGDGDVDLVYLIYAGYSESLSGNSSDCIWPKSGTVSLSKTFGGKKIRRYGINNELNYYPGYKFTTNPEITKRINGIGLFCHEFSHTMGLPDLYSQLPMDNQAMEYWDLMDGGEYTDNGYTPTPYTPWEKEVMGWMTIETLDEKGKVTLGVDDALKVEDESTDEYIILHNIQNEGWAQKLLGHGMLVYRIDYPKDRVNIGDNPNTIAGRPGITIVPADSLLITSYRVYSDTPTESQPYSQTEYINSHYGDPFPGSGNVDSLLNVKLNESLMEKPIYNIKEDANTGIITFDFLEKENVPDAISNIEASLSDDRSGKIFTIDGRFIGSDKTKLSKGIYILDKRKIIVNQ